MTLYKLLLAVYIKPKWLPVAGLQMFPMRKLRNLALVQFLRQRNMQLSIVLKSRSCPLLNTFKGTFLAVSHWKLRMGTYGWVSIQPSQLKQANLRTGFDVNVFFRGVLQFQLVRSLTRRWTWCISSFSYSHLYELCNKPFPSSRQSLFQSESKCEIFVMVISSNFNVNENWLS